MTRICELINIKVKWEVNAIDIIFILKIMIKVKWRLMQTAVSYGDKYLNIILVLKIKHVFVTLIFTFRLNTEG